MLEHYPNFNESHKCIDSRSWANEAACIFYLIWLSFLSLSYHICVGTAPEIPNSQSLVLNTLYSQGHPEHSNLIQNVQG